MSPAYLQPGVNGEGPRGRVHAGHVLTVVDVLQGQFVPVVPAQNISFRWVPPLPQHCPVPRGSPGPQLSITEWHPCQQPPTSAHGPYAAG